MERREQEIVVKKVLQEIQAEQNDNVIIGYVDFDQLAHRLVKKGVRSAEGFEIGTDMIGVMTFIKPRDYREKDK